MKKVVLVIDDMPDERKLVRLLLRRYDCQVLEAGSVAEALKLAQKARPNAILIDHMMPGMNGYDGIHALREEPELRQTPILMLTSRKFDAGFGDFMRQRIGDFLQKPVESKTLLSSLQRLIGTMELAPQALAAR